MEFQKANVVVVTEHRINGDCLLLGRPSRGPFQGRLMLPGGKKNAEESEFEAACRELHDETGLRTYPNDLTHIGVLRSYFEDVSSFEVDVFRARDYQGTRRQTDEFPNEWKYIRDLDWEEMLLPDSYWLTRAIARKWLGLITIWFGPTCNSVRKIEIDRQFERRLVLR